MDSPSPNETGGTHYCSTLRLIQIEYWRTSNSIFQDRISQVSSNRFFTMRTPDSDIPLLGAGNIRMGLISTSASAKSASAYVVFNSNRLRILFWLLEWTISPHTVGKFTLPLRAQTPEILSVQLDMSIFNHTKFSNVFEQSLRNRKHPNIQFLRKLAGMDWTGC